MKKIITAALGAAAISVSLLGAGTAQALISDNEICEQLDDSPTKSTILAIALEELADNETTEDIAIQFAVAAVVTCPTHHDLIEQTFNEFAEGDLT